jgi:2-aminoadipate transaminase
MSPQTFLAHAEWTTRVPEGEIRRLLKSPVRYYFGGGVPGAMPTEILTKITSDIAHSMSEDKSGNTTFGLFNYGPTAGNATLRKLLLQQLVKRQGLAFDPERDGDKVMITAGAQQALYAILDCVLDPGDAILCAGPSYLGLLSIAAKLNARIVLCPSDEQGLIVGEVERALRALEREGTPARLLYVIPESDNPRGTTLPKERREGLFQLAKQHDVLLIEDAAYKEIQFAGARHAPIKALDVDNQHVAYVASTSKEAGVLRLGYCLLPDALRVNVEKARGFYDLCSPLFMQRIAEQFYALDLDTVLPPVVATYQRRCAAMLESIEAHFPSGRATRPSGGFFVWWESDHRDFDAGWFNANVAIPNDVLFVPSAAFYPLAGWQLDAHDRLKPFQAQRNGMRLSFSTMPEEEIREGLKRLGGLLRQKMC